MKIVIAGGTGFLGTCLSDFFVNAGDNVVVLTRGASRVDGSIQFLNWNGHTIGPWIESLDGADVLINLNGKSVDCRYNETNKALIYSTRLDATRILGQAIAQCSRPPRLWINASSATIYRHSIDKEMNERNGEIGNGFSVDVCRKWEAAFNEFDLPRTRKVIVRTGIVLGRAGALKPLRNLASLGAGGRLGSGAQYVSWLHEADFVQIIQFIIDREQMEGVYNVTAPTPVPNKNFMRALRKAVGVPIGFPMPAWLLEFGAFLIGTETELILKSRRVVPERLMEDGYRFQFGTIEEALEDLVK